MKHLIHLKKKSYTDYHYGEFQSNCTDFNDFKFCDRRVFGNRFFVVGKKMNDEYETLFPVLLTVLEKENDKVNQKDKHKNDMYDRLLLFYGRTNDEFCDILQSIDTDRNKMHITVNHIKTLYAYTYTICLYKTPSDEVTSMDNSMDK